MGFSPTFIVCNLYILATAITVHATSSGREGNSAVFLGAADQELSAAALNVPVDFQPYEETWGLFKKTFGRQYRNDAEETHKYRTFVENAKKIERHNAQFRNGNATFWMGINRFADMDLEEYQAFIRRLAPTNGSAPFGTLKCSAFVPPSLAAASSDSVDWRKKGYVTEVKNQKSCGSCWAFSATGSLEGQHFRKTGKLVSLSEQQLVDCAGTFGNKGCDGGYETAAFAYIFSAGGINSETDYPYEAQQGKCRFVKSKIAATLSGCKLIQPAIEKVLQASVRSKGPVSVAIDASSDSFRHYAGGVYVNSKCGKEPKDLDHAVLAVGYGTQGTTKDYWIVKNSWGKTWGQKGYILMARNRGNMCGIATAATFPVV